MFKVHGYLDNKKIIDWRMDSIPRLGDTMRFSGERYGKVTEVIWCMDESSPEGQRINLRIESQPESSPNDQPKA